jgi:hypothetical protein
MSMPVKPAQSEWVYEGRLQRSLGFVEGPTLCGAMAWPSSAMCSRSGQPLARSLATAERINLAALCQSPSSSIRTPRGNS